MKRPVGGGRTATRADASADALGRAALHGAFRYSLGPSISTALGELTKRSCGATFWTPSSCSSVFIVV